jgi:type VI secretion system protein ImpJ
MDIQNTTSLKPIFWHQGQFLQPQHFQHIDEFHKSEIDKLTRIANPYFFGVVLLELNEGALANDVFEVVNGEFIMPDGCYVDCPDNALLPPRSFTPNWTDRHDPLRVYVGIRKMNHSDGNVTILSDFSNLEDVHTRYISSSQPEDVPDLYQKGPDAQLKQLTKVVKLFWQNEIEEAQDYTLLPIAEIIIDGGVTKLSPVYIPPCLHIASSEVLLRNLKEIRDELAGRVRQLEDYKTPIGSSASTHVDGRLLIFRMMILHLSQNLPLLFHYIDTPTLHPWEIYAVLRQLIGGISSLSSQVNFLGETETGEKLLPEYVHSELGQCFQSAYQLTIRLLNEITISSETIVRLERISDGKFKGEITPALIGKRSVYISLMTADNFEKKLDSFMNFAKIASMSQVEIFADRSLSGLQVHYLSVQPEGVPRRPNTSFLMIDVQHPVWDEIQTEKNIVLLWDDAPEDLKVDIIAV